MLALPASPSIWHAPDGTIPSGLAEQARAHPYGRSSQSLPTTLPLRVAFPAGRLLTRPIEALFVPTATTDPPQARFASRQTQATRRKQSDLRGRSRPWPPSRSCLARLQRTRSTV